MILPIYTYGNAVLRKHTEEIGPDYPELKKLIENMFETMYHADGVGLAAPQVGLPIRLLVIDLAPLKEDNPDIGNFKVVMINPVMLEMSEEEVDGYEGCLSIPGISEKVVRAEWIKIQYYDADFKQHTEEFEDYIARVIQHEYDHLEGSLFTDHVNPLRRQMIKSKLNNIAKGKAQCDYKIR
ncbi:MAG: peptide deformylase [Paludibacter sp.]|nr:peptide deformylase [Paludibacter sp.]